MSEKIDLSKLGVCYTVLTKSSAEMSKVRVIDCEELYCLTDEVAPLRKGAAGRAKKAIAKVTGFYKSPYQITWYTTTEENYSVQEAVAMAKAEGNEVVVVEIVPDCKLDTGFEMS